MRRVLLFTLMWVAAAASATEEVANVWSHFLGGANGPEGGVVRMDLDVTGDGVPEIFLTDGRYWARTARTWQVYSPQGESFRFLGTVRFHDKLVRFDPGQGRITAWETHGIGRYVKVEYQVSSSGIEPLTQKEIREESGGDEVEAIYQVLNTIDAYRQEMGFRVVAASPSEFAKSLSGGELQWRDLRNGRVVGGLRRIVGADQGLTRGTVAETTLLGHFHAQRVLGPRGFIYMLQVDLTGDGEREVLLNSEVWNRNLPWLIYTQDGGAYRYLGSLAFDYSRIRLDDEQKVVRVLRRSPKVLEEFKIDASGVRKLKTTDWSRNWAGIGAPELQAMKAWAAAMGLQVLMAPFPDQESVDAMIWRKFETEEVVTPSVTVTKALVKDASR